MLDLAAKLDATAEFLCKRHWGELEFPPPFGRDALPEVRGFFFFFFFFFCTGSGELFLLPLCCRRPT